MQELYNLLRRIPKGKISTYKILGKKLKIHPRKVGKILNNNNNKKIPCYKIVLSSGFIGGYNKGVEKKIFLLKKNGIKLKNNKVINFNKVLFRF